MKNRIEKLLKSLKSHEGAIISSKANIFYYSGFTSEDALLYISHTCLALLTDSRYTVQAKEQAPDFEIVDSAIMEYLKKVPETDIYIEENYLTVAEKNRFEENMPSKSFISGQKMISYPRYIKDSAEIAKIKAAEALGDAAFSHILQFIKPGISEKSLAFELEMFMKKNGASDLSFETVCASGIRSSMPHGTASEKIIRHGDFLTLDFGCVLDGYCSDMTRTVIVGSPTDSRQTEIYNLVLKAQETALEMICPNIKCADADKAARDVIEQGGYGKCFGHSLGHSVGIEIHENPNLSPKSQDILTPGNVVTVEPGIYIENFGGVRIEDLIVITDSGYENLTKSDKHLTIL